MTFEHAPVTKALMIFLGLTSVAVGIFDIKHNAHLQLVPHLSKHHQYWRLFVHHLACASSSDLFVVELLLYNAAVHIERAFGTVKYASFLLIILVLNTINTMLALLTLHMLPTVGSLANHIPAGPTAIIFSILYQYYRLVPEAYEFKVFGVTMSDKIWVYASASQLALGHTPASLVTAITGLISGYIYRSDLMQLKGWRVPHRFVLLSEQWIQPLIGQERPLRRANRVFPEARVQVTAPMAERSVERIRRFRTALAERTGGAQALRNPTVAAEDTTPTNAIPDEPSNTPGVVRQWVSELRGAARPSAGDNVRVPPEAEISLVSSMFPDLGRDVILGVLQRSANVEAAVETLLSSSPP